MKQHSAAFKPRRGGMGPKIVALGGGTGLSTMLRGLKEYTKNITAIVTVTDDGGGSGVLRQDLGMPPPGDIRNLSFSSCQHRTRDGRIVGVSFYGGNPEGTELWQSLFGGPSMRYPHPSMWQCAA